MVEIGSSIGRYHILEQLGQGGMATVYKAYDTRLENEVALKILRVEVFGPAVLERLAKRFEREAKLMAAMSHRGIVKVVDYGEYNGAPYLVMELVPGGTLKDRMGKPFPYAEAARLVAQVARALNYAHQRQHPILHRDVKPANILINEEGELVLTDFGIAKILEESEGNTLTGTGVGIGTPEYMAPEQGLGKEVDARADIYALGVVFFELVTGRKPFIADTPLAVLHKQIYDPLPRPRQYVPNLPKSVEQVIFKALAKKPEDRYQSMGDFAAALEGLARSADQASTGSRWQGKKPCNTEERSDSAKANAPAEKAVEPPKTVDDLTIPPGKKAIPRFWKAAGIVAAISMIAVIGIFFVLRPPPAALPSTITPVLPGPVTPTLQPSPFLTASPEATPTLIPFGTEILRLGDGILYQIAYSPDGKTLVAATSIGIQFYDAISLEKIRFIPTESPISSIAFSPDGDIVATGSSEGIIEMWDAKNSALLQTLEGHTSGVLSIAFSPDGGTLASGEGSRNEWYEDNSIRIWDVKSGTLLHTLDGHTKEVTSISFSPDGRRLVSSSSGGTIKLWDAEGGGLLQTLDYGGGVSCVTFSPDGRWLLSGSGGFIKQWDAESGRLLRYLVSHPGMSTVRSISISPDGIWLAAGLVDGTIYLIETRKFTYEPKILTGHTTEVSSIVFSPDGLYLVSASLDHSIKLWEAKNGVLEKTLESNSRFGDAESVVFSPDGSWLASGSNHNTIKLWDAQSGALLQTLEGHTSGVNSVVFSPDGSWLASGSWDGTIRLWDAESGTLLQTLEGHTSGVDSVVFSPDGSKLASGSRDKTIRLWDAQSGALLQTLEGAMRGVNSVVFSPDGIWLASGSTNDNTIKLWDAQSGALLQTLEGHTSGVNSVVFSPDGRRLASASYDKTIMVWNAQSGVLLQTLDGHNGVVTSVVFSPDGRRLASGSWDGTIRLWDAESGTLLQTLKGNMDGVTSVAFSPDGNKLASSSEDGTIRIWNTSEK